MTNPIVSARIYYSETEEVEVENRGLAGFGKVYVFHRGTSDVEAVFLWTSRPTFSESGVIHTTDEQRGRGLRALMETDYGAAAFGVDKIVPEPYTPKHLKENTDA